MDWMADNGRAARRPAHVMAAGALRHHARAQLRTRQSTRDAARDPPLAILRRRDRGAISVYAQGDDYHDVIKPRLEAAGPLADSQGRGEARVFVDTAAVMEKPLAAAAGLGWQGKHTNLVSRQFGSWLFLGAIFTTLDLPPDGAGSRPLRQLPRLPRYLPDEGISSPVSARCAPMHFLSHDRAQRTDSARIARRDRQPHLWLRRLPGGLPLEQVRADRPATPSLRARESSRRLALSIWSASTTQLSGSCSRNRRSNVPGAIVSCATC